MRLVVLLTVGLPFVALAQQPERFEFKGIPFGITQAQFEGRFPLVICKKPGDTTASDMICSGVRKHMCELALSARVRNCAEQLAKDYSYGGAEVDSITASFFSNALSSVSVKFKSRSFHQVFQALVTRYGKPDDLKSETVQTRAGVAYENSLATWRRGDSVLRARKYAGNIDDANVDIRLDSSVAEFKRREKEGVKKGAGDL